MTGETKKIGLTGVSGYVGSRIIEYFRRSEHEIFELGRRRTHCQPDNYIKFSLQNGVSEGQLSALDVVVNMAYDFSLTDWGEIKRINIDGTTEFFETVKAADSELVHVSSLSAFPGCKSKYGKAKRQTEIVALDQGHTVIRPGLVYGADLGGLIGTLSTFIDSTPVIGVPAGGPYIHYLCNYVDLATMLLTACEEADSLPQRPLVAASADGHSFREILRILAVAHDTSVRFVPVPASLAFYLLRGTEMLNLPTTVRSDSIRGLIHPHPDPDFRLPDQIDVEFREFTPISLLEGFTWE